MPRSLFDKVWESHEISDGLIHVDLHLVHEVTSPQAFAGLRQAGRRVRRPDRTVATADHNVPADGTGSAAEIKDALSRLQVETLERNCDEFGVPLFSLGSEHQGIVHVTWALMAASGSRISPWTASSRTPGSTGVQPVARCAWA